MKFYLLYGVLTILILDTVAIERLPQLILKHGPLYGGIQNLLAEEKSLAQLIWNDTKDKIQKASEEVELTLTYLYSYGQIMEEKLKQLNDMEHYEALQECYIQYERQIARFNRDLISKYLVCKQALNSSQSQLQEEIRSELYYIRDASIEVQELRYDCNVTDLKKSTENDRLTAVRSTMCILARLGNIKQHQMEATHVCFDILGRIVVSDMDNVGGNGHNVGDMPELTGGNVCLEFRHLRDEFESIYERIISCILEDDM
ncbi:uncharacterized protein LOC142219559 [Haematobia irritans]|uniref:uncharacterized protein LOC142219559 n=1 Tax=Haematobia irritans TaxID=7368 RepID=UPI003F4F5E7D